MPGKRFLIAPLDGGLQTNVRPWLKNASYDSIKRNTIGCIMRLRKDAIDLTGQKFGDLTVVRPIQCGKIRGVVWECKCICGNISNAPGGHLRAHNRKSCGCRSESRIKETGVNRLYSMYKRKAKLRNLEFKIDKDKFEKLIFSNCTYCGCSPKNKLKRLKTDKLQIQYTGIDRSDPLRGYTNDNCVSCCYYCNHAKLDMTFKQFKNHIERIAKWLQKDS